MFFGINRGVWLGDFNFYKETLKGHTVQLYSLKRRIDETKSHTSEKRKTKIPPSCDLGSYPVSGIMKQIQHVIGVFFG